MGGYGSGLWRQGKRSDKATTSDLKALDVRWLHRKGILTPERYSNVHWPRNGNIVDSIGIRAEDDRIVIICNVREDDGEWGYEFLPVLLNWTLCHFGGQRPWFLCPDCGRRVAILYGGETFACRLCRDLAYMCQRKDSVWRAHRRMFKIQARLGWKSDCGPKPKNMHWSTFLRLVDRHHHFSQKSLIEIAKKLNIAV